MINTGVILGCTDSQQGIGWWSGLCSAGDIRAYTTNTVDDNAGV